MINLYTTSQVGFREKRMVFQLDSSPGNPSWMRPEAGLKAASVQSEPPTVQQLRARSVEGSVGYMPPIHEDSTIPEGPQPLLGEIEDVGAEVSGAIEKLRIPAASASPSAPAAPVDVTAETHDAMPASLPPIAAAPVASVEPPLELDTPVARTATPAPAAPAARPNRHMERAIPTVRTTPSSAAKSQPKTGFFAGLSRMFSKITPPADPKSTQRALDMTPNAPQRFPKVQPISHSDVLYADNVREGQTQILPAATLTERLSRANSNDIYAQIKASHPKLKIGFDGQIEGFSPIQRLTFASKLEKDPVLAAAVYELQRRNNHVRAVQRIY